MESPHGGALQGERLRGRSTQRSCLRAVLAPPSNGIRSGWPNHARTTANRAASGPGCRPTLNLWRGCPRDLALVNDLLETPVPHLARCCSSRVRVRPSGVSAAAGSLTCCCHRSPLLLDAQSRSSDLKASAANSPPDLGVQDAVSCSIGWAKLLSCADRGLLEFPAGCASLSPGVRRHANCDAVAFDV